MTDERIIELINAGIDGEINESEKSELQDKLDQSGEARELHTGLQDMANTLSALPAHEPPAELRKNILENVNLPRKKQQATRFFRLSSYTGYGLALAAGLVMIVGIYRMGPQDPTVEDISNMTGTIIQQKPAGEPTALDSIPINLDTISGMVSLVGSGDNFVLEFDLKTTASMSLVVEFNNNLQFDGFSQPGNNPQVVGDTDGSVRISTQGDAKFALNFNRSNVDADDAAVQIATSIYSAGARVHEGKLTSQ